MLELRVLIILPLLLFWAAPIAHAQINVVADDDTVVYDFTGTSGSQINGNDFRSYLEGEGFNAVLANANLVVDGAGTFTFTPVGSEAGFGLSFSAVGDDGTSVFIDKPRGGPRTYFSPGDPITQNPIGSVSAGAGGLINPVDLIFGQTDFSNNQSSFGINSQNFGIFVPDTATISGLSSVIFAFNDTGFDTDFDDLVIRADFVLDPVSVPGPGGFLMLALFMLWLMVRKTKHHARGAL